ncbi:MAG: PRC-barrel domain-containing protein [Spirochaetales bacterium]|nr:PRC-barrel domain-containing protein [Spirochaetales bacterium]
MLQYASRLEGFTIHARDGDVGKIQDMYFDDEQWAVRHLVVRAGGWLFGRRVLISPLSVERLDWEAKEVRTWLSREQVEKSPDIDTDQPVSRQQERKLHLYYGMPVYWGGSALWGNQMIPAAMALKNRLPEEEQEAVDESVEGDSHLRSRREVNSYYIQARDGDLGHVEDFLLEEESWAFRYLVVDTRNWLPGRKVLVHPAWIEEVSWYDQRVRVDLERERIRSSPEFHEPEDVTRDYEALLFDHYGRSGYWGL